MAAGHLSEAEAVAAAAAAEAARQFTIEAWTLLGVAIVFTMLRAYSRFRAVGIKRFKADDYLVWVAILFYVAETVLAYSVGNAARGLANNGMTDEERLALSPDDPEYRLRVLGSKIQVAGWSVYALLMWSLKASWLVFYLRLTAGLSRRYMIRIYIGFGFVGCSCIVVLLNLFLSCRPLHRFWQIYPNPGNACQPALSNPIIWTYLSMNVSTDAYLLSIPLPMLWGSTLKLWKKVGLMALFGGGIAVIACAILRCVLIVTDPFNGAQLAGSWAIRESFIAVVATNMPMVFPLIKLWFTPVFDTLLSTQRYSRKLEDETPPGFRTFGGGGSSGPSWRGRGPPTANPITSMEQNGSKERMVDGMMMHEMSSSRGDGSEKSTKRRDMHKQVEVTAE